MGNLSKVDLDPKGYAVLAGGEGYALVFRGERAVEPFVIASGYDPKTGTWAHGSYYADLGRAWECFQDDIIEDASVRWVYEDIERALEQAGAPVNGDTVEELLDAVEDMRGWRDSAISRGNEMLEECAANIARDTPRKVVDIRWDVDGLDEDALCELPKEVMLPEDCDYDLEDISDFLSTVTGVCHDGFRVVAASRSYIEARMMDAHGDEVEGYFWATDDIRYALHETLERANEENVGYEYVQLFACVDVDEDILVAEFRNGNETIFREYTGGRS